MKDCRCDICGEQSADLSMLYEKYQIDGMKDLCSDCGRELNDAHSKITGIANKLRDSWVCNFLRAFKKKNAAPAGKDGA